MRRAQYSVETLFVVGISMALLIPVMLVFYDFLLSSSDNIIQNQINQLSRAMEDHARIVYYYGKDAMTVLDVSFPDRIMNMSIDNNDTLAFRVHSSNGPTDYSFPLGFNATANFTEQDWQRGAKTFRFTYMERGDYVLIERAYH
jgi:hypothetical protein